MSTRPNDYVAFFLTGFPFLKMCAVSLFFFFSYLSVSFSESTLNMKKLSSAEWLEMQNELKNGDFLMLFQPDCSSCKVQVTQLSCLKRPIKLLGTNGSEERISSEYQKLKTKHPGYFLDLNTLKKVNPKFNSVTPQFFAVVLENKGPLTLKNLGFGLTNCVDLKTKIDQIF